MKSIYLITLLFVIATFPVKAVTTVLEKFEVLNSHKYSYSYKEVCDLFNHKDLPLIDPAGSNKIDCMGNKVNISLFCNQKLAKVNNDISKKFMRGIIDQDKRKVICQTGDRINLKEFLVYRVQGGII
ncbi:MAG: hypothetical protein HQK51_05805, partial [Oligoflexia bacterium]|nr:hypothetical protein [Oligoflexia bacterium]